MLERTILGLEPRRGGKVAALAEKPDIDNARVGGATSSALVPYASILMFYVIGLGLSDEKDITLRGLEVCHFHQICHQLTIH
jgi:hypothetical protein